MSRKLNNRLKRRRSRRQTAFLILSTTGFLLVVSLIFAFTPSSPDINEGVRVEGEGVAGEGGGAREEVADMEGAGSLTLGLGGDVSFGLEAEAIVAARGAGYPWEEIAPLLAECDFNAVNLESTLCRGGAPNPAQTTFLARGDISCAAAMSEAGVDAVNLANDHAMDYNSSGLEETLNNLHGQAIEAFGAGPSLDAAVTPVVLEAGSGARLALLSFCDVAPASYAATADFPGISVATAEGVAEAVRAAAESNYVVVYFHWGELNSPYVTDRQRELAQAAVTAGADLVVGSHPHVVQGIEVWQGVPILYSLGNLIFSASSTESWNGVFASCRFDGGSLADLEIVPLRLDGARPAPLEGDEAVAALEELASRSPSVELEISPSQGRSRLSR